MFGRRAEPEVVVITGATAGVGRATVRMFASRGARIGLIARGREGLEATAREVQELGGVPLMLPCDVADPEAVEAAAERAERELGPIDIWINNAMTAVFARVQDTAPAEFRRVTDVTYLGQVYGTLAALKRMRPRDRGTIVFVGSALAYRGIPLQASYCGAKHAVQGFYDSLRTELMHDESNIRITMVQLPALNTPQFDHVRSRLPMKPQPVPPIFQPEVAARAIVHAAHHPRREMYVAMPTVQAIAGNKISPSFADWYLARRGVEGQQTDEPEDPNRRDNLFEPMARDEGAHGRFDSRSRSFSPQVWANTHRGWVGAGLGVIAAGALALVLGRGAA